MENPGNPLQLDTGEQNVRNAPDFVHPIISASPGRITGLSQIPKLKIFLLKSIFRSLLFRKSNFDIRDMKYIGVETSKWAFNLRIFE